MSNFDIWARSFEDINNPVMLESDSRPATGLYMTKKPYMVGIREYYESPVFHVWIEGKHETTMNLQEAYKLWESRK